MWILNEIEKEKKSKSYKKYIIAWIILLIIWWYFSYANFYVSKDNEIVKEIKTAIVTTSDLKTSISWDGKVLYKEDYNLNFPISWTVKEILKDEWSMVFPGDIIATLDTKYLEFDVDKAEGVLKKAEADLLARKNQYSSSDIKLSQDQLDSVKANLDNVRLSGEVDIENAKSAIATAEISLSSAKNDLDTAKNNLDLINIQESEKYNNKLEDIITTVWKNISFSKDIILEIDILLWVTKENEDKNDSFESFLWAKDSKLTSSTREKFKDTNDKFQSFLNEWKDYRTWLKDLERANYFLDKAEENSRNINATLWLTLEVIKNSIPSANSLSQEQIDSYISIYEKNILDTKSEIEWLVNARQNAIEQKTTLETKLKTQENIIISLEWKYELAKQKLSETNTTLLNAQKRADNNLALAEKQINISETSLLTKTESPTYSELAPYYSNIDNAKKSLEESKKKLEDAVLRSPVEWKVVKINWNIWSFVWWDKDTSFVTITNNSKFYVESYVEELDITRILENAKVYLTFDAIDWVELEGQVYFISDKSTTDNNWVVTYKVDIAFDPKESWVREWMTTYVEYITNEVKNVMIIPVWAVRSVDGKPSVQLESWESVSVITWFTDWKNVEIISWLNKWDKVIY